MQQLGKQQKHSLFKVKRPDVHRARVLGVVVEHFLGLQDCEQMTNHMRILNQRHKPVRLQFVVFPLVRVSKHQGVGFESAETRTLHQVEHSRLDVGRDDHLGEYVELVLLQVSVQLHLLPPGLFKRSLVVVSLHHAPVDGKTRSFAELVKKSKDARAFDLALLIHESKGQIVRSPVLHMSLVFVDFEESVSGPFLSHSFHSIAPVLRLRLLLHVEVDEQRADWQ